MKCYDVSKLRRLVFVSILLAFVVVAMGAYTRLTHAGLGCPDWPGCYGQMDYQMHLLLILQFKIPM